MSSLPLPLLLPRLCATGQASAKQNYRALWVMICPFCTAGGWRLNPHHSLSALFPCMSGRDGYSSLTAASSRQRPGESPSQQNDAMGVNLSLQTAAVGSTGKPRFKCQPCAWEERRWHLHSDLYNMAVQDRSITSHLSTLLWVSGTEMGNWDALGRSLIKLLSVRSCES